MGRFQGMRRPLGGFIVDLPQPVRPRTIEQGEEAERSLRLQIGILNRMEKIMRTLDEVLDVVTAQRTKIKSLTTLVSGIKHQLDEALGGQLTPSQQMRVDRIFNELQENDQAIVEAIDANDGEGDGEDGQGDSRLIQTQTTVTSSNSRSNIGDTISLSAGVEMLRDAGQMMGGQLLAGSVVFYVDGEAVGTAALDSTGVAAIRSKEFAGGALTEGEHEIVAKYAGGSVFAPSESDPITQTVVIPDNAGGTTFAQIKDGIGKSDGAEVDGAGNINELPQTAPSGPTDQWPGDPANFGMPTTQTRNTRPGLPDTPGVPNAGASAQGDGAVRPGARTKAPGDDRVAPGVGAAAGAEPGKGDAGQFSPADLNNASRPIGVDRQGDLTNANNGGTGLNAGSALAPGGTFPSNAARDPVDPYGGASAGTMRADGGVPFVDPNNPPSPTGVDLGNDKQVGKAGLDPEFRTQEGNPSVAGATNAAGASNVTDRPVPSAGGSADN